jgi:hypothetical protein
VNLPRNRYEWFWLTARAIVIGTVVAVLWVLTSGCGAINWMRHGDVGAPLYIIHDTVHDDYWSEGAWTTKGNATKMFHWRAEEIVTKHRVNEEGEYSDPVSNAKYPLKIERVQ